MPASPVVQNVSDHCLRTEIPGRSHRRCKDVPRHFQVVAEQQHNILILCRAVDLVQCCMSMSNTLLFCICAPPMRIGRNRAVPKSQGPVAVTLAASSNCGGPTAQLLEPLAIRCLDSHRREQTVPIDVHALRLSSRTLPRHRNPEGQCLEPSAPAATKLGRPSAPHRYTPSRTRQFRVLMASAAVLSFVVGALTQQKIDPHVRSNLVTLGPQIIHGLVVAASICGCDFQTDQGRLPALQVDRLKGSDLMSFNVDGEKRQRHVQLMIFEYLIEGSNGYARTLPKTIALTDVLTREFRIQCGQHVGLELVEGEFAGAEAYGCPAEFVLWPPLPVQLLKAGQRIDTHAPPAFTVEQVRVA